LILLQWPKFLTIHSPIRAMSAPDSDRLCEQTAAVSHNAND